jgi:threonine synthase
LTPGDLRLACVACGRAYLVDAARYVCDCGGLLEARGSFWLEPGLLSGRGVWRYASMLPAPDRSPWITLNEGATPLVPLVHEGGGHVAVKLEGQNPTGSFKDRGMTVGLTWAKALGVKAVACASTGNTSASAAAYAARAGLPCIVLLPEGKVAAGKVAQAVAHGARLVQVRGSFDDAMGMVSALAEKGKVYLLNSLNPLRLEGQKTLTFEIVEAMGWHAPDRIVFPVGNAGNVSAAWKALRELKALGLIDRLPKLHGVQADGAAPIARALAAGADRIERVAKPETVATAIRIGDPVNAPKALAAFRESKGSCISVPDSAILEAQRALAREGFFVEPASAAPLAGYRRLVASGEIAPDERVVLVATGHGLKDAASWPVDAVTVDPTLEALEGVLQ